MHQRYFIELSYKGTHFHGWQIQDNANSVQAEVNKALSLMLAENIDSMGAGRTDTGVHAKQFFAHFDTTKSIPERGVHQLNGIVHRDIIIHQIFQVRPETNARFDAKSRTYEYWITRTKNPFLKEFACFYPYDLNMPAIEEATNLLTNYSDFKCFSKNRTQVKTTLCKIMEANWQSSEASGLGTTLVFKIKADRFLRNMVRAIVGTLLEVGRNELSLDGFKKIIEQGERSEAGASVPACGLYLTSIEYPWEAIKLNS